MINSNFKEPPRGRLKSIDAIRGIAALSVVIFHLYGNIKAELTHIVPNWIETIISYGYLGVPVFFVLSGFVITASVNLNKVCGSYVGRFILRRSLRLDPPYWAAIILASLLMAFKSQFLGIPTDLPSLKNQLLHMVYLQDIMAIEPKISVVFWTLCLEIQFYFFFILSAILIVNIRNNFKLSAIQTDKLLSNFLLITSLISLISYHDLITIENKGWFIPYWHFLSYSDFWCMEAG